MTNKKEWDAPFPEDDCWYQFFKQAMVVWHELHERASDEARTKLAALVAAEALSEPRSVSLLVGQRVRPVKECRLFRGGQVIEVGPVTMKVLFDEPPAEEYRNGENPATVLPEWFAPEPPPAAPKPKRPRSKKTAPIVNE
jgi:hypothetical protein